MSDSQTLSEDGGMRTDRVIGNERGIALVVVLLVVLAIAAIIAGAALLGSSTSLISKNEARLSVLETVADAGIEQGRSAINGNKLLYPDSGFNTLEAGVAVTTASGAVIPGVKRWLYVGPSGVTTGQYGVFGSIVSVAQDAQGNRAIRRGEVYQEPFSKYAYFSTIEAPIVFGNGDQIQGPVFSDDQITIHSTGATFLGPVATAQTINGKPNGTFKQGFKENVPVIPLPTTADLNKLKNQALYGNTEVNSTTLGDPGQATTRIEFVALDLDNDNDSTDDDEGFMKVYQVAAPAQAYWVMADTNNWAGGGNNNGVRNSPNCGHNDGGLGGWKTFERHLGAGGPDSKANAPGNGNPGERCFLGGSDSLNLLQAFLPTTDGHGVWLPWTGPVDPRVTLKAPLGWAPYLWPINRTLNPNFRGVVYVQGKVAISGKLRGRVTLAASGNIIIADDITYVTNPGAANCADILGMFSGDSVIVADNLMNNPVSWLQGMPATHWEPNWDESIDGFVLALDVFTAQNYANNPVSGGAGLSAESCAAAPAARGCLAINGGVIQRQRGAVGLVDGHGYVKRYAYDPCGATDPPPYFPTTGHFASGHYFEVEPTGFNINSYWSLLVPH